MGTVHHIDGHDGYTLSDLRADACGISSETREVAQLALDSDDDALRSYTLDQIEEAQDALLFCARFGCDQHGWDRLARDVIGHAIREEHARLEAADEAHADGHGPDCCHSASGCSSCAGGGL